MTSYNCTAVRKPVHDRLSVASPDGTMAIFAKDDNLWLRTSPSGAERQLTHDGEPHFSYGTMPGSSLLVVLQKSSGIKFLPFACSGRPTAGGSS